MIVLDECHHAVGLHPDNHVMEHYMAAKFESECQDSTDTYRVKDGVHLPLILGKVERG